MKSHAAARIGPTIDLQPIRRGRAGGQLRVATCVIQEVRAAKPHVPSAFAELTKRELEVLRLIAEGQSNLAIARGPRHDMTRLQRGVCFSETQHKLM